MSFTDSNFQQTIEEVYALLERLIKHERPWFFDSYENLGGGIVCTQDGKSFDEASLFLLAQPAVGFFIEIKSTNECYGNYRATWVNVATSIVSNKLIINGATFNGTTDLTDVYILDNGNGCIFTIFEREQHLQLKLEKLSDDTLVVTTYNFNIETKTANPCFLVVFAR